MIYSSPRIGKISSNDANLISHCLMQESVGRGGLTAKGMTNISVVMEIVYILTELVVRRGIHLSNSSSYKLTMCVFYYM